MQIDQVAVVQPVAKKPLIPSLGNLNNLGGGFATLGNLGAVQTETKAPTVNRLNLQDINRVQDVVMAEEEVKLVAKPVLGLGFSKDKMA